MISSRKEGTFVYNRVSSARLTNINRRENCIPGDDDDVPGKNDTGCTLLYSRGIAHRVIRWRAPGHRTTRADFGTLTKYVRPHLLPKLVTPLFFSSSHNRWLSGFLFVSRYMMMRDDKKLPCLFFFFFHNGDNTAAGGRGVYITQSSDAPWSYCWHHVLSSCLLTGREIDARSKDIAFFVWKSIIECSTSWHMFCCSILKKKWVNEKQNLVQNHGDYSQSAGPPIIASIKNFLWRCRAF